MKENRTFTHEEVLGAFHGEIEKFKNDSARIPSRKDSKSEIFNFAKKIYYQRYKKALPISVLDKYSI